LTVQLRLQSGALWLVQFCTICLRNGDDWDEGDDDDDGDPSPPNSDGDVLRDGDDIQDLLKETL